MLPSMAGTEGSEGELPPSKWTIVPTLFGDRKIP